MGRDQSNKLKNDPELRALYETYIMCRATEFQLHRVPTGKRDGSERLVTVVWPLGIYNWPDPGGVDDQDYFITRIFNAFLRGEQRGSMRNLNKKS